MKHNFLVAAYLIRFFFFFYQMVFNFLKDCDYMLFFSILKETPYPGITV